MGRVNYWLTYTFPKPVFIYLLSVGISIRNPVRNPDRTVGAGTSIRNPVRNPDRTVGAGTSIRNPDRTVRAGVSIRNPVRNPDRTAGAGISILLNSIFSPRHFDFYFVSNRLL